MHTGWELAELYMAEMFWPTGEPADNLRALMLGSMNQGNPEAEKNAQRMWRKLTGMANPATANKRGMNAEEIKHQMMALTK